jgi:hypothetical protein
MRIKSLFFTAAGTALLVILLAHAAATLSIALTTNAGLKFGQIVATTSPGTVTVTPAGLRSASGGVALGNSFGVASASFTVMGDPNASYGITLPGAVSLSGGTGSMMVDTFTSSPNGSGTLGAGGTQILSVGATLHVGAGQHSTSYSGLCDVSVDYD